MAVDSLQPLITGENMARQKGQEGALVLARRSSPALKTREMTSGRFKPKNKVRLTSSEFLYSAYNIVGQRFPKGEIGEIIGQGDEGYVVVRFEGEDWEVEESKLALVRKKTKKVRPKTK